MLRNKNIIICVTGGIAAYKAVELASMLRKSGANVNVVMTKSATKFVTPLTFKSITKNKVTVDLFDESDFIPHISLSELADLIVVAPATANIIAKAAHGIADDMCSSLLLSAKCPKLIVPAMNSEMFMNKITQDNITTLIKYGFKIVPPDKGVLACGTTGVGRYPDNRHIIAEIKKIFSYKKTFFENKRVIITLGGTIEDIDPVRYISNRSSGRMGLAFAEILIQLNSKVTLIVGNVDTSLLESFTAAYPNTHIIKITSAQSLKDAIDKEIQNNDALIMCAAVADYKPQYHSEKMKKTSEDSINLSLFKTTDIIASLPKDNNKLYIAFSAETSDLLNNAQKKLINKKVDFIIANEVCGDKSAMGGSNAEVILLNHHNNDIIKFEYSDKNTIARQILLKIDEYQY